MSFVVFIEQAAHSDAEHRDAEPGEEGEVVDGVAHDVGLVQADDHLKVGGVFDRDIAEDDAADDAGDGDEESLFSQAYEGDAEEDGESDAVEDAEEDGSVWHDDEGRQADEHAAAEDVESSGRHLQGFFPLLLGREGPVLRFKGLADADNGEKEDLDDDVRLVELGVEFEDAEIVEVPHEMQDDHEHEGEAADDIEFDEACGRGFFEMPWIHRG